MERLYDNAGFRVIFTSGRVEEFSSELEPGKLGAFRKRMATLKPEEEQELKGLRLRRRMQNLVHSKKARDKQRSTLKGIPQERARMIATAVGLAQRMFQLSPEQEESYRAAIELEMTSTMMTQGSGDDNDNDDDDAEGA